MAIVFRLITGNDMKFNASTKQGFDQSIKKLNDLSDEIKLRWCQTSFTFLTHCTCRKSSLLMTKVSVTSGLYTILCYILAMLSNYEI